MKRSRWAPRAEALAALIAAALGGGQARAEVPGPQAVEVAGDLPLSASGIVTRAALESAAANQALYLQTFVNGVDSGLISPYRLVGGSLYGDAAELRQLGFRIDEALVGSGGLVELSRIPGLVYRLDTLRQIVEITVGADQLQEHRYDASAERLRPSVSPGAVLNYDAYLQQATSDSGGVEERSELYSGLLDLRAFATLGTLVQTGVLRRADPEPPGFAPALRLDTTLFHSDVDGLSTWRAGDLISGGGLPWATPVRLGGLQWQRNFRLQPNLVTFPVPTITGSSAVPSTVDVLVNNVQRYSQAIEPGPFVIDNMPVITGQGEIRVVVRDALGREQVSTLPFYASSSLLRRGLVDYSVEAGWLRRNYAVESNDYADRPAALASARTGVTDWLTLESHAESTEGLYNGGIGGVVKLGLLGVLSTSLASSSAGGVGGEQWGVAYQWFTAGLGFAASTQRATAGYRNLASVELGAPPTREVSQASFSTSLAGGGLSLAYVQVRGGGLLAAGTAATTAAGTETRIGTLSYSLSLRGQWAAHASVLREFGDERGSGGSLGLSRFFGLRRSASVSAQYRDNQETVAVFQAGQGLPAEGTGAGWRVQGSSGVEAAAAVNAGYRTAVATVEAGAADNGDATTAFAGLRGALVGMDLHRPPLLANPIHDSFALVDTVVPGIAVLHENRPVGRSNGDGLLLLTNLTSQARNQIAIDPRDVPLDAQLGSVREFAVPLDRSGVFVQFPVERVESALLVLQTADGQPVPVGASVTVNERGGFVVGYDGQAFVTHLGPRNWLTADWGAGRCEARFDFHSSEGSPQEIGPLRCMEPER